MNRLKHNIIANFLGRGWTNVLLIAVVPLYLKFVGIEAYGLIGIFIMLQSVIGFMDLGMGAALNREMARLSVIEGKGQEQRDLLRTLEIAYWSISILAGLSILTAAPFIAHNWIKTQNIPPETVLSAVRLMGVAIILQFPFSFYQGGLMGLQKQVLLNSILVVVGTFRWLGSVIVLWLISPTLQIFLAWQIISGAFGSGLFIYYLWHSLPTSNRVSRFRVSLIKGIWKYAVAMGGNAAVGVLLTQLDKIILSRMLTLDMFAYYTIAATVAAGVWSIIIPFNSALFPRFVQLFETRSFAELNDLFHLSSQILSVILLPTAMVLIFFSREILIIWTQNITLAENASLIVSLLVIGTTINGMASVPAYAASAFGWPHLITYTNIAQSVILVPAIVVFTGRYGAVGAASVWVALNCSYLFIMLPIMFRRHFKSEKRRWYIYDQAIPCIVTLAIGLIGYLVMPSNLGSAVRFVWLAGMWALGVVASICSTAYVRSKVLFYLKSCQLTVG